MKKRILSIFLTVAMAVSLFPQMATTVQAIGETTDPLVQQFYVANADASEGYNVAGNDITGDGTKEKPFLDINKAIDKVGNISSGKRGIIILLDDIKIDTKGNMIRVPSSTNDSKIITLTSEGKAHKIIRNYEGYSTIQTCVNSEITLENVIVDGNQKQDSYGAVFLDPGTKITMGKDAKIINCANRAVNIRKGATFIMEGGEISGNTAAENANYYVDGYTGTANAGAGVYVCNGGTFIMTGGTITGNTASVGAAGVFGEANTTIKMSGSPKVKGNTMNGIPSNVYLKDSQKITLTGELTNDANIGVYVTNMPTEGTNDVPIAVSDGAYAVKTSDSDVFVSDIPSAAGIKFSDDKVVMSYSARYNIKFAVSPGSIKDSTKVTVTDAPVGSTVELKITNSEGNVFDTKNYLSDSDILNAKVGYNVEVIVKSANGDTIKEFSKTIIADDIKKDTPHTVSGIVKDHQNNFSKDANVKLMQGKIEKGSAVTNKNGEFTIENVSKGTYNLVVTKGKIIFTTIVVVDKENYTIKDPIILPKGNQNSVVEVTGDAPSVVVKGLDEQFSNDDIAYVDGKPDNKIEIKLVVDKKQANDIKQDAEKIATVSNGKKIGLILDLSIVKTITDNGKVGESKKQPNIPNIIEIIVPLSADLQGKTDLTLYRVHSGIAQALQNGKVDSSGEYFAVSGNEMRIYTKNFSTYAIAYKDTTTGSGTTNGGTTGGSTVGITRNFSAIENLIVNLPAVENFKKTDMAAFEKVEKEYNKLTNDEKTVIDEFLHNKYKAIAKQAETMRKAAEKPAIVKPTPVIAPKPKPTSVPKTSDETPIIPFFVTMGLAMLTLGLYFKGKEKIKD